MKSVFEQNSMASFKAVQKLYGETTENWSRGVCAYERLVVTATMDLSKLDKIENARRERYSSAIRSAGALIQPAQFHAKTSELLQNHISELVIDRLEALEELEIASGLGITLEGTRASEVQAELSRLLDEIAKSPSTEIDAFLTQKLSELQYVLEHYTLFGAEGVQFAVDVIIGGGFVRATATGEKPPEPVTARLKRVGRVVKGAVDAYVYPVQAVQAIEWSKGAVVAIGAWLTGP